MKKTLFIGVITFLLAVAVIPAQEMNLKDAIICSARGVEEDLQEGTMVAVLNFASPSEAFTNYVIEEITGELVIGRKLAIVDRQNLALISKEMNLQLSGDVSDESAQAIGKLLGAQAIISGSLSNMGTYYRFRIRVISVETARILTQIALDLQNDAQAAFLLGGSIEIIPSPAPGASPSRKDRPGQTSRPAGAKIFKISVGNVLNFTGFYDHELLWRHSLSFGSFREEWEDQEDTYVFDFIRPTINIRFLFSLTNNFQLGAGLDSTFSIISVLLNGGNDNNNTGDIMFLGGENSWDSGILAPYAIIGYNNIYVHAGYDFVYGGLYLAPSLAIGEHLLLGIPVSVFGSKSNPVSIISHIGTKSDVYKIKYFQIGLAVQYVF
jgi:TolB-like protein